MKKMLFSKSASNTVAYVVIGCCAVAVGYMIATQIPRSSDDDMRDIEVNSKRVASDKSKTTAVQVDDVVLNVRPGACVTEVVNSVLDARDVRDSDVRNTIASYFKEGGVMRNMLGEYPDNQELATLVNSSITNKLMLDRSVRERDMLVPENMRFNGPRLFANAQRVNSVVETKDKRDVVSTYVFGAPLLRGDDSRSLSEAQTFGYMAL